MMVGYGQSPLRSSNWSIPSSIRGNFRRSIASVANQPAIEELVGASRYERAW